MASIYMAGTLGQLLIYKSLYNVIASLLLQYEGRFTKLL